MTDLPILTFEHRLPIIDKSTSEPIPIIEVGYITSKESRTVGILSRSLHKDPGWFIITAYPDSKIGRKIMALRPEFMELDQLKESLKSLLIVDYEDI